MLASPTGSTASSQSTVPPTETTVSSENTDFSDPLLEKVFLAGCRKNFVGPGPCKFSKAEIKELDIADTVEFVAGKLKHSQFRKSIIYQLGLCRIYQQAVAFFEEDVVKFHDELNSLLYNDKSVRSTPKKAQKPKKKNGPEDNDINAASIHSLELTDHNFVSVMERKLKTDKHLLNEMDDLLRVPTLDTLGDFGDEPHLDHGLPKDRIDPFGSPPLIPADLIDNVNAQAIFNGFETFGGTAGISSGTLVVTQVEVHHSEGTEAERPSSSRREDRGDAGADVPAKGTPKRKPGSPYDDTPSKRQRIKSPTDPSGKMSVSRKLFGSGAPDSSKHDHGIMRQNKDQDEVGPFDVLLPLATSQEGTHQSSIQIEADPTTTQGDEVEHETEQPPAAVIPPAIVEPPQGVQHLPGALLADLDDTELEELPEETIAALTLKRRKRIRPLVDEKTQIPRMDITNFEKYVHVHTKTAKSMLANLDKQSLKSLLSMPSTKLNARGLCTWSQKLQYSYMENAHPILHPNNGQNITPAGINDNNADPDRELMPPPPEPPMLPLPSNEQAMPRTPRRSQNKPPSATSSPQQNSPRTFGRNRQPPDASSPQQTPPHTPGRDRQPYISAVSPRQELIPQIIVTEPESAAEAEQLTEAQLPFQMSPTPSARERSTLMDERMFYKLLEDKWVANSGKVELDDLIDPQTSTLTKFHRYFTYLQSFQAKKKLSMEQETIYGPVYIRKTIEE